MESSEKTLEVRSLRPHRKNEEGKSSELLGLRDADADQQTSMAATPPREQIKSYQPNSPFENLPVCQTTFAVKTMSPKHYSTTTDSIGAFYRQQDCPPAYRVEGNMVRAPMPSAYYLRERPFTADDMRPSVGRKAPAAFPRLSEGMQGSIMRTPGVMWQSKK